VLRFFPVRDKGSSIDKQQSRLMIAAALLVLAMALVLSIAPAVRYHAGSQRYRFDHWLGVLGWFVVFTVLDWQASRKLPHRDPFLLPIISALTGIGLMMIWRLYPSFGLRQTIWLVLAGGLVFLGLQFTTFVGYLHRYKYILLVLGLILTALTIIFGQNPTGTGPALWLKIFGVYFQPSEPLKLLLIAYLAGFFTDRLTLNNKALATILPTLVVIGLALGLLISQRDLGTAIIFMAIYLLVLYTINGNRWVIWLTPVVIIVAAVIGYFFIDIVHLRLSAWFNPLSDTSGASYQVLQSMIAIAEGGILGTGFGLGSPGLIPVSLSDFIYAALGEEFGLLGLLVIVVLFSLLVYRAIRVAIRSEKTFHRYLAAGIGFYFGFQSILIIGGNIGFLPLTGVTLPFISYGGSSLLVSFVAFGILYILSQGTKPVAEVKKYSDRKRFYWAGIALIGLLVIEFVISSLLGFWFKPSLVRRPENARWAVADRFVPSGDILDRNGQVILTSKGETGEITRENYYIPLSPIVGYANPIYGQTGIEASMSPYLRGLEGYNSLEPALQKLVYNQPPDGLNIKLTIDLTLQKAADDLLGDQIGAAVLMNADNGEILTMASHPYFDSTAVEADWDALVNDGNAPLVNRATQGLYPAGATLMPFIVTDQNNLISTYPDPATILTSINVSDCSVTVNALNWSVLIGSGCLTTQAELAAYTGEAPLLSLYQRLGFFTVPDLRLPAANVDQPVISDLEAFFRGESVTISPLQLAMAASTLTNGGTLPAPRIVIGYEDPQSKWVSFPKLGEDQEVLKSQDTASISRLLTVTDSPRWQAVSTIHTADDAPITWFMSGTTPDWQGQPYVVIVALETDDPNLAAEIGTTLLEQAMNLVKNK
jgi:cell division protein FtsW (lipid II flippase)